MQLSDVHGHIAPHAAILKRRAAGSQQRGMAKLAMLTKRVRLQNPNNPLPEIGDTTHGNAEMLFSLGGAIMPMLNPLGNDALTPAMGNFAFRRRVVESAWS